MFLLTVRCGETCEKVGHINTGLPNSVSQKSDISSVLLLGTRTKIRRLSSGAFKNFEPVGQRAKASGFDITDSGTAPCGSQCISFETPLHYPDLRCHELPKVTTIGVM